MKLTSKEAYDKFREINKRFYEIFPKLYDNCHHGLVSTNMVDGGYEGYTMHIYRRGEGKMISNKNMIPYDNERIFLTEIDNLINDTYKIYWG